jgi:hypothetical protein
MCNRLVLPFPCWVLLCNRCDVLPPLTTLSTILRGLSNSVIKLRQPTRKELIEATKKTQAIKKSPTISPHLKEWVQNNFEVDWKVLEDYFLTDYFMGSINLAHRKKKLRTIFRLLSCGVVKLRLPSSQFLHSTLELKIQVRLFSKLIPASQIEQNQVFSWVHLRPQVTEAMKRLSSTISVGYHGNLNLGGKIWMDDPKVRKSFPGRPHFSDLKTAQKAVAVLDEYFLLDKKDRQPGPFLAHTDCPNSIPQIISIDDTIQPFEDIHDKEGWKNVYGELKRQSEKTLLNNLTSKKENTPLDFLHEANLLDSYEGSILMRSKSTRNDMFFLDKVGSEDEMYELSILQALLMVYNLLTPKRNERGWWMIATGLSKGNGHKLHERAQTNSYSPEMKLILDALLFGYKVLESRFCKWVEHVTHCPNYFLSQRKMASKWDLKYDEAYEGKERNVKILQELVQECWLSIARGTVNHLDKSNYGFSIAIYHGIGWSSPRECFGIPELQFLWKHSSGSMMAIRGWQWFHMSLSFPEDILKMMNACFVNEI